MDAALDDARRLIGLLSHTGDYDDDDYESPYDVMRQLGRLLQRLHEDSPRQAHVFLELRQAIETLPERLLDPLILGMLEHLPVGDPLFESMSAAWKDSAELAAAVAEGASLAKSWATFKPSHEST